ASTAGSRLQQRANNCQHYFVTLNELPGSPACWGRKKSRGGRLGELPRVPRQFRIPALIKSRRTKGLLAGLVVAFIIGWLYWNRPQRIDLAAYAPSDCLAFVEANDLTEVAEGIEGTQAWRSLAVPVGAPTNLPLNRWLIRLARWTGLGSADALLLARSQIA